MAEIYRQRITPFYAEIHGEFRQFPVHVWRLGTRHNCVALTNVGKLYCITLSLFGRQWTSPDIRVEV